MKLLKALLLGLLFTSLVIGCGQQQAEEQDQGGGAEVDEPTPEAEEPEVTLPEVEEPEEYPQFMEVQDDERLVKMVTNKGEITIKLFPTYAPLAVENFITHSENGYYDGIIFHRVMKDFMIQGGDPLGNGTGGESVFGQEFEDEFTPALAHFRGALAMANRGPNTNGSQFFIVHNDSFDEGLVDQLEEYTGVRFPKSTIELYKQHGGTPHLDYTHTVFGHVVEGMDVVDAIANVEVDGNARPQEEIVIERIEILK